MAQDPFEKFRDLLDQNHQFPSIYMHKFIGMNSNIFKDSVAEFEKQFIGLNRTGEKLSASGKHLSLTYEYNASSADEVVLLFQATQKLNDIIYII